MKPTAQTSNAGSSVGHPASALTLADAAPLVASGQRTSVELTAAYLERIDAVDSRLNAFITVMRDDALRDARAADAAVTRGDALGPLHGLPIALKDLFDVHGVRATAGSKFFVKRMATADAAVVERLRGAGAVIIGKLNMHEWALGVTNDNPHFGACRGPRGRPLSRRVRQRYRWIHSHSGGALRRGGAQAIVRPRESARGHPVELEPRPCWSHGAPGA
jgi:Asp-tRNA(Asn)/Glu-tRNA(Gln) amidotransferase A subunit family amidase